MCSMRAKHHESHIHRTLLNRVRTMWLKDVLEPSLNETKRIPLRLQEWRASDDQKCWSQGKPLMLPADMNIADLYERNRWELLISGEPGSGKTTLLLELLRAMVDRAEQDEFHPIPVMFHLSSWATQRLPFEQWLMEELKQRYQIPRQCGRSWVINQQLALLLDGLDEVAEDAREGCVLAINAYRETYGSGSIIVSSSTKYPHLNERLQLSRAVIIQPLTDQQIDNYLSYEVEHPASIRAMLYDHPTLRKKVNTPLLLTMLDFIYQGEAHIDVPATDPAELSQQLIAAYVQRMNEPSGANAHTPQDKLRFLTWLAHWLQRGRQNEFYLEQMQPQWLPTTHWIGVYRVLLALCMLPIAALLYSLPILDWQHSFSHLFSFLLTSLFLMVFFVLMRPLDMVKSRISMRALWLLIGLWSGGKPFGDLLQRLSFESGSWLIAEGGFLLILSGIIWFTDRYGWGQSDQWPRKAGRHALISCSLSVLLLSLFGGMAHGWSGVGDGIRAGLTFGILIGLGLGGDAFIEHYLLRFTFWWAGCSPWRYTTFLDEAVQHRLFYKVANGYMFRHQLLLDYFASQRGTTRNKRESEESSRA
jgi:hypothetical protein